MPQGNPDLYIEVLLPLPLDNPVYGYLTDETVERGMLCTVPFGNGRGKMLTGLVVRVSAHRPEGVGQSITFKRVLRILPLAPIREPILKAWEWAAEYCMCSPGDVLRAALPSGIERYSGRGPLKKVWSFSPLLLSDPSFRKEALSLLRKKRSALAFLQTLTDGSPAYGIRAESLAELREKTGLSVHTVDTLRSAGVIEAEEIADFYGESSERQAQSTSQAELFRPWGSKEVLLSYHPHSSLYERVPFDFLWSVLASGQGQTLVLFPSMDALRSVEEEMSELFGSKLYPYYHSRSSDKTKERTWTAALTGVGGIYFGLRSAVWLPFADLKTVVVIDEEDRGYRQFEPAPRFTASYMALMLARKSGAKTLLSTASPSVETALRGIIGRKYAFREVGSPRPPYGDKLTLVDMEQAFRLGEVSARMLSSKMIHSITACVDGGGKALIFYQRQGFARYISCGNCHTVLKCPVCGTTLRYYGREKRSMVCPSCGHVEPKPDSCPSCGKRELKPVGTGVERLIDAVRDFYPGVPVSIREGDEEGPLKPGITFSTGYEPSLGAVGSADMIGVIQWDLLELRPDFRAIERSYRFVTELLNESPKGTGIVLQFFRPYGIGLKAALSGNYRTLLDSELESRFAVGFSPFSRQIDAVIQSTDSSVAFSVANGLLSGLSAFPHLKTLGPSPIATTRAKAEIGSRVTILHPLDSSLSDTRHFLAEWRSKTLRKHRGTPLFIHFDVDPQ